MANLTDHRNISAATVSGMAKLMSEGRILKVRNQEIREIRNNISVLKRPLERCLFVPHRGNNIFASVAETFWVLAGRNDVAWLKTYLPRAPNFSDNGITWRAAYGPRLRDWSGIDQIEKALELLLREIATRRAVMSIFDPASDFIESKDIPCNNWLHWLIREGKLHLNVGVRSNDIVWGFSGVNSFEWSVLHELMAFWAGVPVGEATYFASSFHIYDRHYEMAGKAVRDFQGVHCYDFDLRSPTFCTPWKEFNRNMRVWFDLESAIRRSPRSPPLFGEYLSDPLLKNSLGLLALFHGSRDGWTVNKIRDELAKLPATDLTAAAYEFFSRKYPEVLEGLLNPALASFFKAYFRVDSNVSGTDLSELLQKIKALHREKDAAYGNAWKRRGEQVSILANIARKVDRLEQHSRTSTQLVDETILDTAIDLFVYSAKYILFLLERLNERAAKMLPKNAPTPFSDHTSNFDFLVDHMVISRQGQNSNEITAAVIAIFEELHSLAANPQSSPERRLELAIRLNDLSFTKIAELCTMQKMQRNIKT